MKAKSYKKNFTEKRQKLGWIDFLKGRSHCDTSKHFVFSQLFCIDFFHFHSIRGLQKQKSPCGTKKIGTKFSVRILKRSILPFSVLHTHMIPCRLKREQIVNVSVFCNSCIADLRWPPHGCFHHFPPANFFVMCELACSKDCLLVTIHHLSGGTCMSEYLVEGVNWGQLRWLIVCLK